MSLPSVNLSDPIAVCDILQSATASLLSCCGRRGCSHHVPPRGSILVTGDLHDNPYNLAKIITLASLKNPTNHVVLQELIHGGGDSHSKDLSYRMLVRVAALVVEYPSQVHPILANHELSQVTGRKITKGGDELIELFEQGVDYVFGESADEVLSEINNFVLAMPIAVRSSTGLFCAHSLPNEALMGDFDMDMVDRDLRPADRRGSDGSAYAMVWGRQHTQSQIGVLAEHWGVTLFCLGHAWVPEGIEIAMENVLLLNSDHTDGVALPIALDNVQGARHAYKSAVKLLSVSLESQQS